MKIGIYIFVMLIFIGVSCSEPDNQIVGEDLYETNHGTGNSITRYIYLDNRVDQIILSNDNNGYLRFKVNYQSSEGNKLASVLYYHEDKLIQQKDTIIYQEDLLIQIIKITKKSDVITRQDTSNFVYDELGHLTQARYEGVSKRVDFLDYQGKNFTRFKTYNNSRLSSDVILNYDDKQSPFNNILDLNLVLFNNTLLEGYEYLTDHNVTEYVEQEYQSGIFVHTYKIQYNYDIKDRPTKSIRTRIGDKEFKIEELYNYK